MAKKTPMSAQFADLPIAKKLLAVLSEQEFVTPTPIQHQIIPGAIEGKDVIGIAQTGTGKTLAFGIPMIQRIAERKGQGLILVPTRELAMQVDQALCAVGKPVGLKTAVIIGGTPQFRQQKALKKNPHIVIATPGRLMDLIEQKIYNLNQINVIAFDEADRMLDVGFLPQIKKILQLAPQDRQLMLFSATMPKSISVLASKFMKLPLRIEIAPQGTSAKHVEQELFVIEKRDKIRLLDSILDQYKEETVIVFSRTKHGAKRIARDIRNMGHTATEIHGNRSQPQRKRALEGFHNGTYRVMVATDIAARGIDVKDLALVVNFDLPDNCEDYVHRIGRTGRAGRSGKAISFATPDQKHDVKKIERLIRKTLSVLDLPVLPAKRPKPPKEERSPRGNRGGRGKRRSSNRDKYNTKQSKKSTSSSSRSGRPAPGHRRTGNKRRRSGRRHK